MKLLDILRRWLSQAEITAWEGLVLEMEKRQRDKEADLRTDVEAQSWRLDLGAEPFITLTSNLEIKPVGGNRFEKREPGGQWVRANPMRDFPQSDLVPLQRVGNLFIEWVHLQQGAYELPAAIEEFKREYQRHLDAARGASPAKLPEALEQLRKFYDEQKEALPLSPRKELLEMEFTILLDAFRRADSTKELEDLREQLRGFFRKHRESGADRWEELFIREEHQKEYRARLEEMRQAASPEDIARNKAQLLAFANKYGHYLLGNPLIEIQAAWTHALENNIPPAPPAGLRASVGREEGINLSWNNCPGATQYHTYRSESNAPESKSFLDSIPIPAAGSSPNPTFLDSSAAAGRDYFYWVKATNPKGESDFTGPAKGSRLKPAGRLREPVPQTAPPEVTARMMKAMEEGAMVEAIEIYTLNLAHAEIWVGMLDETLVICHENARGRKESGGAQVIAELLANHRSIQRKLRELIRADGNPVRIRTLTRISARNNDFVSELDEHLRNLNKEEADAKAEAEAEAKRVTQAKHLAQETARADAEAIAKTTAVENQKLLEQALSDIQARCDKVETSDDIKAIKDSFILYHQFSQNEQFLSKWHELLTMAGTRVEEIATSKELHAKILAEVQTQSAQANSMADIHRIELWMREQLDKLPGPDAGLEKQLALFVEEARKRVDPNGGSLAYWAGVKEEQYVNLAIVFTDISGGTMLNSRFGDASWDAIRSAHFRQARSLLEKTHGWYIKDVGDAVVAVFKNAVDALSFAMELEKNPGHDLVRIMAGAHIGTVIIRGNDILGNEVNLAAQIRGMAKEGGVWMSEGVRAEWRSRHGKSSLAFVRHPNIELKGLDDPVTLWSVQSALPPALPDAGEKETDPITQESRLAGEIANAQAQAGSREEVHPKDSKADAERIAAEARLAEEKAKAEAEAIKRQLQSVLNQATAAALAGKLEEVQQLIKSHPHWHQYLEPHLKWAEQIKKETDEAETQFQTILSRAAAAAAAGKPGEVQQLIKSHPQRREDLEPHLRRAEQVQREAEEAERQLQSILSRAAAAAAAGKPDEVQQLIKSHPQRREVLEAYLRRAEQVQREAEEAERQFQNILSRARAAAAAGKPDEVQQLIKSHPQRREVLEPHLRRAEQVKKDADGAEHQARHIVNRATDAAVAGKPEEVRKIIEAHPNLREQLEPHLRRAEQVKREAEEALRHIRQLQTILTRAEAAAAAGKPDEVEILIEKHGPIREQLIPHLHEAIQVQVQARAKEAATPEDIEALKGLLQAHKGALKTQPMLAKALESLLAETEARVHAEIAFKLLKKQLLAEAKKRVEAAKSEEDIQLVNHWVDEEISRLPSQDPTLADELKTLVKRGQETLRERKEPAAQSGSDDWKNQILVRSQAKKFADEGDVDGVQSLIAAKPEMEPQLVSFLQEAVGTQVRCQALCATTKADIVALEHSIQQHGALLGQNVELAAECDALLQQARSAIKARFRRKLWMLFLILAGLAAAGAVVGVMLSRHAPK